MFHLVEGEYKMGVYEAEREGQFVFLRNPLAGLIKSKMAELPKDDLW